MTLTQMRYFYEVCKWRSITKAAASLHISQPTVSIAMADLEKESGLNLFRREGKKLSLTEDGSLLLSKITPQMIIAPLLVGIFEAVVCCIVPSLYAAEIKVTDSLRFE